MSETKNGTEMGGLSKRQQNKLEKLMKSDEANKAHTHAKSYKRKTNRGRRRQENGRQLIKTQNYANEEHSASIQSQFSSEPQQQKPEPILPPKKGFKLLKPYNPKFKVEGGQQGLFSYIMMYAYTEKQKQIQNQPQDLSFLDQQPGQPLVLVTNPVNKKKTQKIYKEFQQIKQKIETPFDEIHRQFAKKISFSNFLNL